MSAWNIKSGEIVSDAAGKVRGHQTRRHVLSFSAPIALVLIGALSACGKKGELEAPRPAAEVSKGSTGSTEEGAE